MKRICIQTWFSSLNFGTCLQAYSLYRTLQANGYAVYFADGIGQNHNLIPQAKRLIARILHKPHPQIIQREKTIRHWCNARIPVNWVHSKQQINRLVSETDCFISGSDQIWNTYFSFMPEMFLSFAKNGKRISYASSIGTRGINPYFADDVRKLLSRYTHISVREETGAQALRALTGRTDIQQVVDPTALLTEDEWQDEIANTHFPYSSESDYMLVYLLGTHAHYPKVIDAIAQRHCPSKIILIPSLENPSFELPGADIITDINPHQFVALIANAKLICTDSFHATLLSIILQKPFIELMRFLDADEKSQNSRLYDLLGRLGLQGQIYQANQIPDCHIDFTAAKTTLSADRQQSLDYLLNAIEHERVH